jgi:hypothetical protein
MMSNVQRFRPRRHSQPAVLPRPSDPAGTIEDFADSGNPPTHAKPDDAEILKAIGELHKKLNTLAKNQKVLSNQLRNLRGLIYNTSDNVILTANYLEQVMYNVGWWTQTGDAKQSADTWPKTPHWR